MTKLSRKLSNIFFLACFTGAACGVEGPVQNEVPSENNAPVSALEPLEIARFEVREGHLIRFVKTPHGDVGMAETAPKKNRLILPQLVGREGATTLEVYLALAGEGDEAPRAVLETDARERLALGRMEDPVRVLTLPVSAPGALFDLTDPGEEPFFGCEVSNNHWNYSWQYAFEYETDVVANDLQAYPSFDSTTFYAGGSPSSRRYLGACTTNLHYAYTYAVWMYSQYKWNGTWYNADTELVSEENRYVYYNGVTQAWFRARLFAYTNSYNKTFNLGRGVAYDVAPGLGFSN